MFNEDHEIYGQYRPTATIEISKGERVVEIDRESHNGPYVVRLYVNEQDMITRTAPSERVARQIAAKLLG